MQFIRNLSNRQPLVSVILVIVLVFATMMGIFALLASLRGSQAVAQASAQAVTGLLLLLLLLKSGVGKRTGVSVPLSAWGHRWWAVMMVMSVVALTGFLSKQINFRQLVFTASHAIDWLLVTMSVGLVEEVWFRGVCFYILYRAWGSTRAGLYRAAAIQALLFGVLHMGNLHHSDLSYVIYQSCFATLIGFGFAGLVAYSRSIWPAVVLHGVINAASSFDNFFAGPVYHYPELTLGNMLTVLGMFFLFGALPGVWCLQRAPLHEARSK